MQNERWKPGVNALEDPISGKSEGGSMLYGLILTNEVQQQPVIIGSQKMKRAQCEPDKSNLARWMHEARGARDRTERRISSVPLSTDRLITFCHLCLNIHLSRNLALERKSK